MENKYFTPDITDIHVGYELEIRQGNMWKSDKVQSNDCFCDFVDMDGYRVPYLTKEQIEAEGWEFIKHHAGTEHYDFEKNGYSLYVDFDFRGEVYLKIYDGEQDNEFNYFSGKCKDINIFRKICKLLEI